MGHEIDLKRYDIRTDLVIDTIDNNDDNIDTLVEVQGDIKITKVTVDDKVSRIIGKKKGRYITIEFDDVTDTDNKNKVEDIFTLELIPTFFTTMSLLYLGTSCLCSIFSKLASIGSISNTCK